MQYECDYCEDTGLVTERRYDSEVHQWVDDDWTICTHCSYSEFDEDRSDYYDPER